MRLVENVWGNVHVSRRDSGNSGETKTVAVDVPSHAGAHGGVAQTTASETDAPEHLGKLATRGFLIAALGFQVAWLAVLAVGGYRVIDRVIDVV
jgi:hypothetical protein